RGRHRLDVLAQRGGVVLDRYRLTLCGRSSLLTRTAGLKDRRLGRVLSVRVDLGLTGHHTQCLTGLLVGSRVSLDGLGEVGADVLRVVERLGLLSSGLGGSGELIQSVHCADQHGADTRSHSETAQRGSGDAPRRSSTSLSARQAEQGSRRTVRACRHTKQLNREGTNTQRRGTGLRLLRSQ